MALDIDQASKILECPPPHTVAQVNNCYTKISAKIKFLGRKSEKDRDERAKKFKEAAEAYHILLNHATKGCKCLSLQPRKKNRIQPPPVIPPPWTPPPTIYPSKKPVSPAQYLVWFVVGVIGTVIVLSIGVMLTSNGKKRPVVIPKEVVTQLSNSILEQQDSHKLNVHNPFKTVSTATPMPATFTPGPVIGKPSGNTFHSQPVVSYGYVSVETYPWCQVFVNGTKFGDAPFSQPVQIRSGKHELQLKFQTNVTKIVQVTIRKNATTKVQYNHESGELHIE